LADSNFVQKRLEELHKLAFALEGSAPGLTAGAAPAAAMAESAGEAIELSHLPDDMAAWLAHRCLLEGVPLRYLVPDETMLPPESIRWFFVDEDWLDSLVSGALSLGADSTRDQMLMAGVQDTVRQDIQSALLKVAPAAAQASIVATPAGFLLCSAMVSGWPRLEVQAFSAEDGTQTLPALRLERVEPGVLLAIFPDLPRRVELRTPPEAVHFAARDGVTATDESRNARRVLDVVAMAKDLGAEDNPAKFANRLIETQQELVFKLT
jgi:hypothetical protein